MEQIELRRILCQPSSQPPRAPEQSERSEHSSRERDKDDRFGAQGAVPVLLLLLLLLPTTHTAGGAEQSKAPLNDDEHTESRSSVRNGGFE